MLLDYWLLLMVYLPILVKEPITVTPENCSKSLVLKRIVSSELFVENLNFVIEVVIGILEFSELFTFRCNGWERSLFKWPRV